MTIADVISSMGDDKKDIKGQDDLVGTSFPVFKLFKEKLELVQTAVIQNRNIAGDVLIWGNDSFGIWNSYKWGANANTTFILGSSLAGILGSNKLGSTLSSWETIRVINSDNRFVDIFSTDTFVNTDNTTATVDTGAGTVTFS